MTTIIYAVTIACAVYVVVALGFLLVMATGLAPEGTRLRKWGRRITKSMSYAIGGLIVGVFALARPRVTRRKGPLREQVRAHAETRVRVREVMADTAAAIRRTDAAADGVVVRIGIEADNRVEAIRAEVAAMDDAALLDAVREVGR